MDAFLNNTTLVVGLSFVIFVALIIWKRVPAMIGKSLDERSDKIKAEIEEARQLKEDAQSLLAQFQRKQRDAQKEADAMIAQAKEEADHYQKEAIANMDALLERHQKAAEEKIAQLETNAVKEISAAAVEVAVNAARQIIDQDLAAKDKNKLVDDGIKGLKDSLH